MAFDIILPDQYSILMVTETPESGISKPIFPTVLYGIWENRESGELKITTPAQTRNLHFDNGNLSVDSVTFDGDGFIRRLSRTKILKDTGLEGSPAESLSIRDLVERNVLSPRLLWKSMEMYFMSDLMPLFDDDQSSYDFNSGDMGSRSDILFRLPTLKVLHRGLRRMTNQKLIQSSLPTEDMEILRLNPEHEGEINLESYETYLLSQIDPAVPLKTLYVQSQLGQVECQKVVFSLLTLGLVGPCRPAAPRSSAITFSPLDMQRILAVFNKKYIATFKYISKEIGPVAWSFLQKCLDETSPHLPPPLKNLKLAGNGRLITDSVLKDAVLLTCDEARSRLLSGLNEILVAMVLTVKKNLGDEHETLLIKILEKTGE